MISVFNKVLTKTNIYWTTVKVMVESLDKMNLKGISNSSIEEEFYNQIFETIKSVSPEYQKDFEKVNLLAKKEGMAVDVSVEMVPIEKNSSLIKSKLTFKWDDLPDMVREKIMMEKSFNQSINFTGNE